MKIHMFIHDLTACFILWKQRDPKLRITTKWHEVTCKRCLKKKPQPQKEERVTWYPWYND